MKILGIDPGTARTGWGLIEKDRGVRLVGCGLISGEGMDKGERLSFLEKGVEDLIKVHKPDLVCLEKLFFSTNKKTASSVSEARGVVLLVIQKHALKLMEFGPSEMKSAVAGNGAAGKKEVSQAVMWTLKIQTIPGPDDVSDALAIALMGAFSMPLQGS